MAYKDNKSIGFNTSGEHYSDKFNIFGWGFWSGTFPSSRKSGRPKGSLDSRPRKPRSDKGLSRK